MVPAMLHTRPKNSNRPVPSGRGFIAAVVLTLAATGLVAAGGCKNTETTPIGTGGGGNGGAGGGDVGDKLSARDYYIQFVHPEIDSTCGVCHQSSDGCVPKFMDSSAESSYLELKGFEGLVTHADNSNLVYHGAHTGPALTEFQESLVRTWLDKELAGDDAPKPTLSEALVEIGRCMREQDFIDEGVYLLAYQQSEHGPCGSCHRTGEAGTWIGYNEQEMYDKNTRIPWIKRLVKPVYDGDNRFVDLAPSNRFVDKVESANACGSPHPAAAVTAEMQAALENYVEASLTRWRNDACEM